MVEVGFCRCYELRQHQHRDREGLTSVRQLWWAHMCRKMNGELVLLDALPACVLFVSPETLDFRSKQCGDSGRLGALSTAATWTSRSNHLTVYGIANLERSGTAARAWH